MMPTADLVTRARAMADWALTIEELKRLVRDLAYALEAAEQAKDTLAAEYQRLQQGLQALIDKWTKERRRVADKGMEWAGKKRGYEAAGICAGYESAVDDLSALLASPRETTDDK